MWRAARSAASTLRRTRRFSTAIPAPSIVHKRGADILHDPWFNKDTGFPMTERDRLGLRGLLPPRVISFEQQYDRFMESFHSLEKNTEGQPDSVVSLAKWRILNRLHDRNETLYYRVLIDNIKDFAPIIYTPTVGLVCQNYSGLFRRPRGMYFSAKDKGEMMSMIFNWPSTQVDMIVLTDGSRILGLGDLGVQGIGIPIGKLDMYVAAAGINPQRVLPVMLDVGTNNQKLLEDPLYLGLRQPRLEGEEYLSIVDEFVEAVHARWPKAVVQFEDFQAKWAFETLDRYRKKFCMFNDDIQGTAGVALAGLLGTVRAQGRPLTDFANQKIVVVGAGSAGLGVLKMALQAVSRMAGPSADPSQVQGEELLIQFNAKYLARVSKPETAPVTLDRAARLEEVMKLNSLRGRLTGKKESSAGMEQTQDERSFFDPAPVTTVEDGKAYLRRIQKAQKQKEAEESMQSASVYGMENSYQSDAFGIYGNASMVPRVYQASGFDPYLRDVAIGDEEEDPLRTSSLPHIAWQQLEEWGLAMFMHLYCRNIRRLLAYHVKDVVEAFLENANALNECGVMADVLLRRVPSQALLCPPGQTNQMTNVSLSDMLHNLAKSPLFYSKDRGVYLFEEHQSFEKYLNVGDPSSTDYSSLERQQYVLERLIMLSKDRSLDRFRWDKGAAWKGKEWTESLPTDAEILMNTFCCMMDNMLPADNERDRPFWKSYYFSKGPNRPFTPRVRSRLFLVQTVGRPPHFKALVKGAVREIVPGEENCFHAIVVYLHAVKKMKAGYLESINLHRIIEQVFDVSK